MENGHIRAGSTIARHNGAAVIHLTASPSDPARGTLACGPLTVPCALGRTGIRGAKREGDGATPAGRFRLGEVFYRPDRLPRPRTNLRLTQLRPDMGWCDDPANRAYNRPVRLPFAGSHELLWRDDGSYDILVVLDYNLTHPVPGQGSAIFLHLAAPGFAATAGCVAVTLPAMRRLLALVGPETALQVG